MAQMTFTATVYHMEWHFFKIWQQDINSVMRPQAVMNRQNNRLLED